MVLGPRSGSAAPETALSLARGAVVVQAALAILVGVVLRKSSTLRSRALLFDRISVGAMLAGLGLTLGIAPLANEVGVRFSEALHAPMDSARWVTLIVQHANRAEFVTLGLTLTVLPACVEELLFRGLLMGALAGANRAAVLLLQAAAFGLFHADWAQGTATFVLGLGFGFLRMTTRSLVAPMVAHATYNLVVLLTMRWMGDAESGTHQAVGVLCVGTLVSAACAALLERSSQRRVAGFGGR
jgi:membrane protease YdiL (CAAX protease family)